MGLARTSLLSELEESYQTFIETQSAYSSNALSPGLTCNDVSCGTLHARSPDDANTSCGTNVRIYNSASHRGEIVDHELLRRLSIGLDRAHTLTLERSMKDVSTYRSNIFQDVVLCCTILSTKFPRLAKESSKVPFTLICDCFDHIQSLPYPDDQLDAQGQALVLAAYSNYSNVVQKVLLTCTPTLKQDEWITLAIRVAAAKPSVEFLVMLCNRILHSSNITTIVASALSAAINARQYTSVSQIRIALRHHTHIFVDALELACHKVSTQRRHV